MAIEIDLAVIMGHTPCQHSIGAWRAREAFPKFTYAEPEFWEDVAQTLEKSCINFLLLADQYGVYDVFQESGASAIRGAVQFPIHDPVPLIPIISRVTQHLAVAVTLSTTYLPPYHIARTLATLDHLTRGRVAWNIVTSYGHSAASAFGLSAEIPKLQRYNRAEESVEICKRLWSSWDLDALRVDRENAEYVRAESLRHVSFRGSQLSSEATFSVPPMPHGAPVLMQAGGSPEGVQLAVRHAEIHFATAANVSGMRTHLYKLDLAAGAIGVKRPRVLWGASVVVAESHDEAVERDAMLRELVPLDGALAQMSADLGVNLAQVPLDTRFSELHRCADLGIQGVATMLASQYGSTTLRELAPVFGVGMGGLRFIGSGEEVAEAMLATLDEGGGEGFILRCDVLPKSLYDIASLLIPSLRRRGRYPSRYASPCLRERIVAP